MSRMRGRWYIGLGLIVGCATGGVGEPQDGAPGVAPDAGEGDARGDEDASDDASMDSGSTTPNPPVDAGDPADAGGGMDTEVDAAMDAGAPVDASNDAASQADAAVDADVPREVFCKGQGPVIRIPTSQGAPAGTCTGDVARQRFQNALCTCEDVDFAGYLDTSSNRSNTPEDVIHAGAPVGINGDVTAGAYFDVGGSLRVQGTSNVGGYVNVAGDLELHQHTEFYGYLTVARDAWFGGGSSVIPGYYAEIGRDVYVQSGTNLPPFWISVGGTSHESSFQLDTPCACAPEDLLPVGDIVEDAKEHNDNAHPDVDLDASHLSNLVGKRTLTLPCGRFYVDEISGVGDLKLIANGRTALFVGGDVSSVGRLEIELGPEGELDLFIAGDLTQIGYGTFGDLDRPAGVRVYVGGDGDITYLGYQPFGGNLYAPRSRMLSDGFVDVHGSLFVRELSAGAYVKVLYDREILTPPEDCDPPDPEPEPDAGPPPPECTGTCDTACGASQTCVDEMCTTCEEDDDCCGPLVCYEDGSCGPLLL